METDDKAQGEHGGPIEHSPLDSSACPHCPWSPSSAAPTSARARSSTGSSASASRSSPTSRAPPATACTAPSEWAGRTFTVVDTGGLELEPGTDIEERVQEQARVAVEEADLILFVVDAHAGIAPLDHEVADRLRRAEAPVILVINKGDNPRPRSRCGRVLRPRLRPIHHDLGTARPQHRRPRRPHRRAPPAADRGRGGGIGHSRGPHRGRDGRARRDGARCAAGGDRWAAEHRQVDLRESRLRLGSHDRQRQARHHARPDRHRRSSSTASRWSWSTRPASAAAGRSSGGSSATACCAA